jgi:hypothetical protein
VEFFLRVDFYREYLHVDGQKKAVRMAGSSSAAGTGIAKYWAR